MRVYYMGFLSDGQTSRQRLEAIRWLGHEVDAYETDPVDRRSPAHLLLFRLRLKLYRLGWDAMTVRDLPGCESAIASIAPGSCDVLWLDKNWTIGKAALQNFRADHPNTLIVGYSPDDMMPRANQSRQFLETLPLYDLYVTTKSYGKAELEALGCKRVMFVNNAYAEEVHRPWPVDAELREKFGGQIGFIGMYEADRAASLRALGQAGLRVRVWGLNWQRMRDAPAPLRLENKAVWGDDYARALSAFDINLAFLCKRNRDLQTTRSIEIPACGGFMLAERTDEHRALFAEGKEAEFFSSDEELLDKVRFYLAHDELRRKIALAGRERCLTSGYGNRDIMASVFERLSRLDQAASRGDRP